MNQRSQNVIVGLFVLGGLTALGVLIVKFGESGILFSAGYEVKAWYQTAAGVREGTQIQLAGMPVGKVVAMNLKDAKDPSQGVFVTMEIRHEYEIPTDSKAIVKHQLMGQPFVDIEPPLRYTPTLPHDGSGVLIGGIRNAMESLIDPRLLATLEKTTKDIGDLAAALTPAAKGLENLLQQRTIADVEASEDSGHALPANLFTATERLHRVLQHADTVLGDIETQSNLKLTFANLTEASEQAKLAMGHFRTFSEQAVETGTKVDGLTVKLDATIDTTHAHIDTLGKNLISSTDQLSQLLEHLNSAGQQLAEGDGTAGLLLRDAKLYEELNLTVKRLGTAASELTVLVKQWQKNGLLGG